MREECVEHLRLRIHELILIPMSRRGARNSEPSYLQYLRVFADVNHATKRLWNIRLVAGSMSSLAVGGVLSLAPSGGLASCYATT